MICERISDEVIKWLVVFLAAFIVAGSYFHFYSGPVQSTCFRAHFAYRTPPFPFTLCGRSIWSRIIWSGYIRLQLRVAQGIDPSQEADSGSERIWNGSCRMKNYQVEKRGHRRNGYWYCV